MHFITFQDGVLKGQYRIELEAMVISVAIELEFLELESERIQLQNIALKIRMKQVIQELKKCGKGCIS